MAEALYIVGTAGHIDHGKTSLVRALTGRDLDTLPEERRRGITIALGFTRLDLDESRSLAFIDCPGHERLVRTMIAGASGIDAVLLCVSASEGLMPQTREHLAIVELLGVKHGLVALTMADLVDDELAELAAEEVADELVGTPLEGARVIVTSAETGAGLDELRGALAELPVDSRRDHGPFRLPVDRCFVMKGFGTVVTGTVQSGRVVDGDEVVLLPTGEKARVRGVQVHGEGVDASRAGLRTALNLAGVEREALPRGTVLAHPDRLAATSMLDVRYRHLDDAVPMEAGVRVRLCLGTAEVLAVLDPLDQDQLLPGAVGFAQIRTSEPVVCLPGDRFVVRRESPITTLGGGTVLDPWASRIRRRDKPRAVAQLERLEAGEVAVLLERAGAPGLPKELAARRAPDAGEALGDVVLAPAELAAHEGAVLAGLRGWHTERPLEAGAPRRALCQGRLEALSGVAFSALVTRMEGQGSLVIEGPRARLPGFQVRLDAAQQASVSTLLDRLVPTGLGGLDAAEATEGLPDGDALLAHLVSGGRVGRVGPRVFDGRHLRDLVGRVRAVLAAEGELTPGRFKELTGLSRKGAIPLLEWLDQTGVTLRKGDVRIARKSPQR